MSPHVHHRSFGDGPRTALAIHCSLGHSGAWRAVGAALGEVLTLHAYDLPNHGRSGDWDRQGIMHDVATDMARAVLDKVAEGPVDLIGHSFGATVALRLAIEDPERVRSATLFEPVYFAALMADDPDFAARYHRQTEDFEAAMDARDHAAAARSFNETWGDNGDWDKIPAAHRRYMTDRIQFVRDSAPVLVHDSAGLLNKGQFERAIQPVLLIEGAASPMASAVNHSIARRLPNASQLTLSKMGHMGPITHPGEVAAAIRAFLQDVA